MTMAEFNIRLFSFKRLERNKEVLFREVAWQSLVGSHSDPKKIPKNKQKFWQIGKAEKVNEEMKNIMKEAMLNARSNYTKTNKDGDS
jgi:hypothetical protein|tara:strand:+ start:801 stop:1061 length:261 start_codon:yes stop_codon:yes gene_type:complete